MRIAHSITNVGRTLLVMLTLLCAAGVQAADRFMSLDQAGAGALMLRTQEPGRFVQAPMVSSDIKVDISGPVARTVITQRFVNPSGRWVEAVYAFPLPEDSAVDTLRMRIGDRFVQGRIEERAAARKQYEQAKQDGKRASLVEQQRPNLFQTSVANIGPNETVVTQIEYQQILAPKDGRFSLRVPLVVAPRYTPDPVVHAVRFDQGGWSIDNGPDVKAPIADPRVQRPEMHNPVTLSVDLAAGFDIGRLESPFHDVAVRRTDAREASVSLTGPVPADRDFELVWSPARTNLPQAALLRERHGTGDHLVLMLTPPAQDRMATIRPREVIFVQDVSGSMAGTSIAQARKGLELALKRLRPEDRFNIVIFNNDYRVYAPQSVQATPEAIAEAVESVRGLKANGGTRMLPALEWALKDTTPGQRDVLRQVIFLTDGAVSNETELFALIKRDLGRSRLFTVGIGSAPNSHFMVQAAEHGRGTHVYIGDVSEVQDKMSDLFAKIETPALTDIVLDVPGGQAQTFPARIPDLYVGDPVVIAVKTPDAAGIARLRGDGPNGPFEVEIPLDQAADRAGVARLWARKHIAKLEAERVGRFARAHGAVDLDKQILKTALEYHVTSRMTSLVAIDDAPARPTSQRLDSIEIAANLPKGWDPAMFLDAGPAPQIQPLEKDTEARLFRINAPAQPHQAKDEERAAAQPEAVRMAAQAKPVAPGAPVPKGSADWLLPLLFGVLALLMGAVLLRGAVCQRSDAA